MSHSVRRHLDLEIDEYDATIRRWIPGYETMLSTAAAAVAASRPVRVVDLGAGTGSLSAALLDHSTIGSVELLDVDPEMLERARARLVGHGDRAHFTLRSFDEPLEAADAFVASLSLHHIPDIDQKARLFQRIFEALPEGGTFVNADATMPEERDARAALFEHWAAHQAAHGISREDAFRNFAAWAGEDTYLPLEQELAALAAAGFRAERVWSDGPIGVVVAHRP